jgi:hypothetical protein
MNKPIGIAIVVFVVVLVGGGTFYAGTKVGENRVLQNPQLFFQQMAGRQGGQFPGFGRTGAQGQPGAGQSPADAPRAAGTIGTIEKIDGNTLSLSTEQEIIDVKTSETTLIQKLMAVGPDELEVGEQVIVTGSRNEDGSITARSIRSAQGIRFGTEE